MQHAQLVVDLEEEILDYLSRHPDAADDREAIFQFWIVRERFLRGLEALDDALTTLVSRGVLEKIRLPGGRLIFRRRQP